MSTGSINTNTGALIALQNLNATNRALETTQNRVNTGMKVANAKDNGAIFAIATNMRADVAALDAVKASVERGRSIIDVAMAAGETVIEALKEMKTLAVAIEDFTTNQPAFFTRPPSPDAHFISIQLGVDPGCQISNTLRYGCPEELFAFGHELRVRPFTNFRLPCFAQSGVHEGFTLSCIPFRF